VELELPDFDLDDNLGEDHFASGDELEEDSSMTTSQKTNEFGTDYVPTIETKINKDFRSKGFFEGEVASGPHSRTVKGDDIMVWKVQCEDGDCKEMTALEIAYWKAPVEEVRASKTKSKSKPTRPKKTVATKPSGDRPEEFKDALPKPGKDASAPTHLRRSTRLQQQALETARMNFLDSNPCLPMDSIGMYKAATCRIHLCDDDPYEELLCNVDEAETLLQDPVALAAIHRLLDPDADLDKLRVSALQSEAILPEERALPRFSRQALKRLCVDWHSTGFFIRTSAATWILTSLRRSLVTFLECSRNAGSLFIDTSSYMQGIVVLICNVKGYLRTHTVPVFGSLSTSY